MKAVLISIHPKWCELIERGKKTVEVRKTRPKLETPFKVYIYETLGEKIKLSNVCKGAINRGCGKVIGEFVCDRIIDIPYSQYFVDYYHTMPQADLEASCLSLGFIDEYLLSNSGYGWNISNLVIYDKPKELGAFEIECKGGCDIPWVYYPPCENCRKNRLTRPPQSWCYVERSEK